MAQAILLPGDYVLTEGMTEEQYHAVAQAFMNAGAKSGEYPNIGYAFKTDLECFGASYQVEPYLYHGYKAGSAFVGGRQLTIQQVLNATNAGNAAPPSPMNCRCVMKPIIKETDLHITDKLCKARKERDESQTRYEQALAEHRKAYPWLAIEERKQPTEDMTDPANWRAGDWLECRRDARDLTGNKIYQVLFMDGDNDLVIDDDADKGVARYAYHFRFYARP